MNHPITIAGGGLAGLALGIALRLRDVNVTIHEASVYPRQRVCGEFISGITDEALERLGISGSLRAAVPLSTACWRSDTRILREMNVTGKGISRWKLDDLLQGNFRSLGGNLVTRSRITPGPGVIWAAGRPKSPSSWIGLKCHVNDLPLSHDLEMLLGTNGYVGLARIEEGRVNICGLFKKQRIGNEHGPGLLNAYLRAGGLHHLSERLSGASIIRESFVGVAGFRFGSSGEIPFSLGDASCIIPPFTGNGMSMALESADYALQPALDYAAGSRSWEEAARASSLKQKECFRKRMTAASLIHPLLTSATGLRVVKSLAVARMLPFETIYRLLR
jgi:flavin-dependent dehydrogenase